MKAFQGANPYTQNFIPGMAGLILKVVRDPKFPKERREVLRSRASVSQPRSGHLVPPMPKTGLTHG